MDLSKAERQTPEEDNRQSGADYVKGLLQDFLFFLVLIFAALLIGWGIFFVLDDGGEWKHVVRALNGSEITLQEPTTVAARPCYRARHWIQLYLIRNKKPQEEQPQPQPYPHTEMADQPYPPEPEMQYFDPDAKTKMTQVEDRSNIYADAANQVQRTPSTRVMGDTYKID
ncbi:uncharacterized protein LOC111072088 isoform X2 [Drosophila obscura]|uniref:uncharacterized protein LOC111072088 isoform X2 n=1 Tax=Drosophila obscura TaxID=7282 RepID=UPI001BB2098C|nr:uncharacterized protein LOC111072088 isoform X2 [Drosophila obscura]